jgi:hypothetical protein
MIAILKIHQKQNILCLKTHTQRRKCGETRKHAVGKARAHELHARRYDRECVALKREQNVDRADAARESVQSGQDNDDEL